MARHSRVLRVHVLMHQTVIGKEALEQMERAEEHPDVVGGCVGGESNFAGLAFPLVGEKLRQGKQTRILAVEPEACPTLTKGIYTYDFGDTVILFGLSGHGHFDMGASAAYFAGQIVDHAYPSEAIQQALADVPRVPVSA